MTHYPAVITAEEPDPRASREERLEHELRQIRSASLAEFRKDQPSIWVIARLTLRAYGINYQLGRAIPGQGNSTYS